MSAALAFPDDDDPTDPPGDQRPRDTQSPIAAGGPTPEPSKGDADSHGGPDGSGPNSRDDQAEDDAQRARVVAGGPDPSASKLPPLTIAGAVLADPVLAMAAAVLDDLERVRVANENRYRQMTRAVEDADGDERGFGMSPDHPDVKRLRLLVDALAAAEHSAILNLERTMRAHPLGPWVKQAHGVGEKQAARLLAAIGDPWWNDLHDRPRTVGELWAYAGYRPGQKRQRGQKINWSADAKMRAYLIANSIVQAGGPYKAIYDEAKAKYADAVHPVECVRCGPSGHPALPGSPLSAGHRHARALRIVAKRILKDLWREAGRLHGADVDTP